MTRKINIGYKRIVESQKEKKIEEGFANYFVFEISRINESFL